MRLGLGNNLVKTAFPIGTSPSLDLAFALDRSFTTDPAAAGAALITSRRGPSAKFSRGSGATQVNAAGLIEYAPENLILRSNEFSSATWGRTTVGLPSVVVGAGPNGESAWQLQPSGSNSDIGQNITTPYGGATYTFSVWLKSDTGSNVSLQLNIYDNTAATLRGSKSITVTSEWQRFEVTSSAIVSGSSTRFIIGAFASWSTGENLLAYGAQVERASTARTYYPTTTAVFYGPRFDYDPATGASKGLLIEETRTNLAERSETLNDAYWSKFQSTIDPDTGVAPDGRISADSLKDSPVTDAHSVYKSFTTTINTNYVWSVFVKADTKNWASIYVSINNVVYRGYFDLTNGVFGQKTAGVNFTSQAFGNGWYRLHAALSSGAFTTVVGALELANGDGLVSYLGNGSGKVFVWGAQFEVGIAATSATFPLSYIPTTSGTAARSADVCSITGTDFDRVYNQSELSIYSEVSFAPASAGFPVISFNNQTAAERVELAAFAGPTRLACFVVQNNATQAAPNISASANQFHKAALYAKLNSFQFALNGSLATKDTVGLMPTATRLNIGKQFNEVYLNGHLKQVTIYRKALTDAKLQSLTAP